MVTPLRLLGVLWALPVAAPFWLFYLLPFWALGWHERVPASGRPHVVRFHLTSRAPAWLRGLWMGWGGHALPYAVVYGLRDFVPLSLQRHELRHTDQWLVFGPLFVPLYLLFSLLAGYEGNPFEVDADRASSRPVG